MTLLFDNQPPAEIRTELAKLAAAPPPDLLTLAASVANRQIEKFQPLSVGQAARHRLRLAGVGCEGTWGTGKSLGEERSNRMPDRSDKTPSESDVTSS
jgi:hypothetical protein